MSTIFVARFQRQGRCFFYDYSLIDCNVVRQLDRTTYSRPLAKLNRKLWLICCPSFSNCCLQIAGQNTETVARDNEREERNIRTCLQFVLRSRKYNLVPSNMFSNLLAYASTCFRDQKRPPFSSTPLSLFFPGFIFTFYIFFLFLFSKYPRKFHYVIAKYSRELRVRFDPFRLSL